MKESVYFVYILRNAEGRLYIGFTTNLENRIRQHQTGESGWTSKRGPWKLVHYETFNHRAEAMKQERSYKRGRMNMELRKRFA